MPSLYYNHPYWPSPRAARIAKLLLKQHEMPDLGWIFEQAWTAAGHPVKPEGRLTHDKALKVMADYLRLSVHEFLHIKPADAILRLKLANTEEKAWRILGNTTLPVWWGGRMPCCVCDRMLPALALAEPPEPSTVVPVRDPPSGPLPPLSPASSVAATATATATAAVAATVAATVAVAVPASDEPREAGAELIETLMEFLKEMNGIVTAGDQRYVTALVQQYKGRVL